MAEVKETSFIDKIGKIITTNNESLKAKPTELFKNKRVALYFSSSWCPDCIPFTKRLGLFHEIANEESDNFEVVLVGSDETQKDYVGYHTGKCSFAYRVPFESAAYFKRKYGCFAAKESRNFPGVKRISGIPSLIFVDENGAIVNRKGVNLVVNKGPEFLDEINVFC